MKPQLDEVLEAVKNGDHEGFCTACGEWTTGVEPDVHDGKCPSCGELAVFGAEQLLVTGEYDE